MWSGRIEQKTAVERKENMGGNGERVMIRSNVFNRMEWLSDLEE